MNTYTKREFSEVDTHALAALREGKNIEKESLARGYSRNTLSMALLRLRYRFGVRTSAQLLMVLAQRGWDDTSLPPLSPGGKP